MTLTDVGDALRAQPMPWKDIPPSYQEVSKTALIPTKGFDADQRQWFAKWWLACTKEDVEAVNSLLPENTHVAATEINGVLYLGSDLLTDSLVKGNTYFPAQKVIQNLVYTYVEPVK